jgi:hypothetical protein
MRTAFRSSSSRLSQDAEKEIATEQRFSVLTNSSSGPPLQCPLHCALHRPQHQAGETAVARGSPPGDGGHGKREDELLVDEHQAQPLELFKKLMDTCRRQV